MENFVHESLECLSCISQAERHVSEFKQAEWSGYSGVPAVFFGTMCNGEDHALDDGQTIPSWNSHLALLRCSGARRLGQADTEGAEVSMR